MLGPLLSFLLDKLLSALRQGLQLPLAMHEYYMPSIGGGHFSHTCLHLLLLLEVHGTLARLLLLRPLALFEELRTWKNACCLPARVAELNSLGVDGHTPICLCILNILSTQPTDAVALSHACRRPQMLPLKSGSSVRESALYPFCTFSGPNRSKSALTFC